MYLQLGCLAEEKKAFKAFSGLFAFIYRFVSFTRTVSSSVSLKYSVKLFSLKVVAADELSDILNLWNPT